MTRILSTGSNTKSYGSNPAGSVVRLIAFTLISCGLSGLTGCRKSEVGTDGSTPKSAGIAFMKAVGAGDLDGVRKNSVGFDDAFPLLVNVIAEHRETDRFESTMTKRFKNYTRPNMADLFAAVAREIEGMKEEVNGDTVTLLDPTTPDAPFKMRYKRDGGIWKADLTEPLFHAALVRSLTQTGDYAKALASVNPDLERGVFKSEDQALKALDRAMHAPASTTASILVPTTRPSTSRPASTRPGA